MMETRRWNLWLVALAACCLWAGCGRDHYQRSADKEVYGILGQRRAEVLGKTNDSFNIKTPYSDRKPADIPAPEILQQRMTSARRPMTLSEALKTAIAHSPSYQSQKETVYLKALTLTQQRYNFTPQWASSVKPALSRNAYGVYDQFVETDLSVSQLLKTGGTLTVSMLNDVLAFYSGGSSHNTTAFSATFIQPLLHGAGYKIVTENLTQAERDVVYQINTFARYEQTFALDIVTKYYQLLQQRDVIRNNYSTYKNLVLVRERAEAMGKDRLAAYQVDQAVQQELTSKSTYLASVQSYQDSLDRFKIALGLPVGTELVLDESPLDELRKMSLPVVELTEEQGHRIACQSRFDVQNEINKFEDSKRKIDFYADALKPDLNVIGHVELPQPNGYDYSRFDVGQYKAYGEVRLDLPLNRLPQRNDFRTSQINFEVELRTLALLLDNVRNSIQADLRAVDEARKNYAIQQDAARIAKRSLEGSVMLLQAGRIDMLNMLTAQSALLNAQNAFTGALLTYHTARWNLLSDLGIIRTDLDRFWLAEQPILLPGAPPPAAAAAPAAPPPAQQRGAQVELIPPDKLFR
ncbi:MAG: TolC family protein [Verrucomicrobia bacterium]|nr:TolC family protein [Verrucomicrobiota bacterium]